jgi:apolipoprotein N-acyltransferase
MSMGVAALVLGIVGFVVSIIPFLGQYALPVTVLALLLGAIGMRKQPRGLATAGLVLGLLGSGLGAYWIHASHKAAEVLQDAVDHARAAQ